ncbi:DNA-processing protein DprA [Acinetobacter kanungonis]|uniref:DNA-processing protein DprA n=1 Tax=Acinetobacter kanungonis TaxID=2699469 RepID=UPI00137B15A2|nr:DNA-processing protein DprA [Acinetobacter kanungonis]NCI77289.1 DNA-processing protein DprA [Acinetobacter kanungonis]
MNTYQLIQKILLLPQVGNVTALTIINKLTSSNYTDKELIDFIQELIPNKLKKFDSEQYVKWQRTYEQIFKSNDQNNIKNIIYTDSNYPQALKMLKTPPLILNYKGNLEKLITSPSISVIGTRVPTQYGEKIGLRIGEVLAERDINVISGLALGCDAMGHTGALNQDGFTCAVLAHGLQEIYPKQNITLAKRILDQDGLLISEYPFGMAPSKNSFVARDRIQAGLSNATIVVETGIEGGTMHAVKTTIELERTLFCVDHPEKYRNEEKVQGNIKLIADGLAQPLGTKDELDTMVSLVKKEMFNSKKS